MQKRLRQHLPFLQFLLDSQLKQRKSVLQSSTPDQVKILSEIVQNLLEGNIPLTPKQKRMLKPHERNFVKVAGKKQSINHLRRNWSKIAKTSLIVLLQTILPFLTK